MLWSRVKHKDTRPLLKTANPLETLTNIYNARIPVYRLADITVDSLSDISIEDMASRVIDALSARPDIIEDTNG